MTTRLDTSNSKAHHSPSTVQRLFDWTLDLDGDIYGDERERLRWYEGIAISTSFQWIAIPCVLAVMAWICSRETAPYLWAFMIVTTIPQYLTLFYVSRNRVNVTNIRWTRKRVVLTVLTTVPLFVFLLGMTVGLDLRSDDGVPAEALVGGITGAIVGGALAALFVIIMKRRHARQATQADLEDEAN